jgi:methyl-accepting chemotaxis protein
LQLHQVGAETALVADNTASSAGALYRAQRVIDEVRGLAALHLLAHGADEQTVLERQIQFRRQAITRELAAWDKRATDDAMRRHREAVKLRLAALWQTLDRLVAVSRLGPGDGAAAEHARQLLAGEVQQAFQALGDALEAWWSDVETRWQDSARRDQAATRQVTWLLSALSGGALLVGGLVVAWITRPGPRPPATPGGLPPMPAADAAAGGALVASFLPPAAMAPAQQEAGRRLAEGSEALAAQADVLAVAAAVDAARAGDAGPGLATLARSVRSLAQLAACVAAGAAAWRAAAESAAGAEAPGCALPSGLPVRNDRDPGR